MSIIVIIVTFNSAWVIERCLNSLEKQPEQHSVIIVDNHSTDATVEVIKNKFKRVTLIENEQNLGYAGGNNLGITEALKRNCDYICILNPDTQLLANTFTRVTRFAQAHKNQGIFGPIIYKDEHRQIIWSTGGTLDKKRYTAQLTDFNKQSITLENIRENDFISGTCLVIPEGLLRQGLRFYEPYFMYYEDVEFSLRAKKMGYPAMVVEEAGLTHTETSQLAAHKNYYLARNHLLFVERNAPIRVQLHEMIRLPKTIWEHFKRRDAQSLLGIKDYVRHRFGRKYGS